MKNPASRRGFGSYRTALICNMVHSGGFEPPTARFVAEYSIQLSYECNVEARILLIYCIIVKHLFSILIKCIRRKVLKINRIQKTNNLNNLRAIALSSNVKSLIYKKFSSVHFERHRFISLIS